MMFRNSNLVLLAVIAASCTTFSTAVDGQSLLRRHLQDPLANGSGDATAVEDQAMDNSNMGSNVADPLANGSGDATAVEEQAMDESNMGSNVADPLATDPKDVTAT